MVKEFDRLALKSCLVPPHSQRLWRSVRGVDKDSLCFQSHQRTFPTPTSRQSVVIPTGSGRNFWRGQLKYGADLHPVNLLNGLYALFKQVPQGVVDSRADVIAQAGLLTASAAFTKISHQKNNASYSDADPSYLTSIPRFRYQIVKFG